MTKVIICPLYNTKVLFISGVPLKEVLTICKKRKIYIDKNDLESCEGFCFKPNNDLNKYVIYLRTCAFSDTMVHETLHLAISILAHHHIKIGMELDEHEHLVYYQGFWINQFRKAIKNKKK